MIEYLPAGFLGEGKSFALDTLSDRGPVVLSTFLRTIDDGEKEFLVRLMVPDGLSLSTVIRHDDCLSRGLIVLKMVVDCVGDGSVALVDGWCCVKWKVLMSWKGGCWKVEEDRGEVEEIGGLKSTRRLRRELAYCGPSPLFGWGQYLGWIRSTIRGLPALPHHRQGRYANHPASMLGYSKSISFSYSITICLFPVVQLTIALIRHPSRRPAHPFIPNPRRRHTSSRLYFR